METSLETFQFYLRLIVGLLLLLNVALLVSVRCGLLWAKQLTASLPDEEAAVHWRKATRILGILIVFIISMNAAAVFAHHHLRQATDAIVGEGTSVVLNRTAGIQSESH